MLQEDRLMRILAMVEEKGSITISELQKRLKASESTVRRALNSLDEKGVLTKVHGGAISKNNGIRSIDNSVNERMELNKEDKKVIAKYAAELIEDNDFVYLDAGTTTALMIDYLDKKNVSFVTNGISIARALADNGYKVLLIGGEFKGITDAIVGEEAIFSLEKYNFTKGFFGTNGIDCEKGFFTPDVKEAMVKTKAIENSKEAYVLADSTKFNQISNVTFAKINEVTVITTGGKSTKYNMKNIIEA